MTRPTGPRCRWTCVACGATGTTRTPETCRAAWETHYTSAACTRDRTWEQTNQGATND